MEHSAEDEAAFVGRHLGPDLDRGKTWEGLGVGLDDPEVLQCLQSLLAQDIPALIVGAHVLIDVFLGRVERIVRCRVG